MLILGHPMTNAHHGAPKNWDAERDGPCETLPTITVCDADNVPILHASFWQPDPAEMSLLLKGGALELHIAAPVHPVVSLRVNAWPGVRHDENGREMPTAQDAAPDDKIREVIRNTIGFNFEPNELQTVNADDLLRLAAALTDHVNDSDDAPVTLDFGGPCDCCADIRQAEKDLAGYDEPTVLDFGGPCEMSPLLKGGPWPASHWTGNPCPVCKGTGYSGNDRCADCGGTGDEYL